MNSEQLLDKIKPHARPTWSARLDDVLAQAERNGWTTDALASATNRGIGPDTGTGYVVRTLERLASSKNQDGRDDDDRMVTGPCQLECDHGWTDSIDGRAAVPCPSCRPDTARRITDRETARDRGASLAELNRLATTTPRRTPHTYPVGTR